MHRTFSAVTLMAKKKDKVRARIPEDPRVLMKELQTKKLKCSRSALARLLRVSEGMTYRLGLKKEWPNAHKHVFIKAKRLYYLCDVLPPMRTDKNYNPLVLWLETPHPCLNNFRAIDLLDSVGGRKILKSFIKETGQDVEWPE